MGQTGSSSKVDGESARARLQGLKLEDVLGDDTLLQEVTSTSTAAFKDYRFRPKSTRCSPEDGLHWAQISGIRFWHLGKEVDLKNATAEYDGERDEDEVACITPVGLFTEDGDEHSWMSKRMENQVDDSDDDDYNCSTPTSSFGALIIRFEQPTAVNEFAFKTHATADRSLDPIRFTLEGSKDGSKWLNLCDETRVDFPTPNGRGVWTKRVDVQDSSVAANHVELEAIRSLTTVAEKRGVEELVQWASSKPPSAPVDEAAALMRFCKTIVLGEKQRRRAALFSMIHSASDATFARMQEETAMKMKAQKTKVVKKLGAGIAAVTAKCATHMLLEAQLCSENSSVALDLLNLHLAEGISNLPDLPACPDDIPEPLMAALTSASEICRKAISPQGASNVRCTRENLPKVAELLLRLGILRASFGDIAAVMRWLICEDVELDMSCLWPAVAERFGLCPWLRMEVFSQDNWIEEKDLGVGATRTAIRSKVQLTSQQITAADERGAYAEIWLVADAGSCRVAFLPNDSKSPDDSGIGFVAGKAYIEGEVKDLEESNMPRSLEDGDVVGLWLRKGKGTEVFVNGTCWGRLPRYPALETSGCFFLAADLDRDAKVVVNIGQEPFKFAPPNGAQVYATAAAVATFEEARRRARESVAIMSRSAEQGERSIENFAVGLTLLEVANQSQCRELPSDMPSTIQKETFESEHPYNDMMDETVKVEVPGAVSMRITFDPRCNLEWQCDWLKFYQDEGLSSQLGRSYTGAEPSCFQPLDIPGDACWYRFTSDSEETRWGFKFTVEAEMLEKKNPYSLVIDPNDATVSLLLDILRSPTIAALPEFLSAALALLSKHLSWSSNLAEPTRKLAADTLLNLARERSRIGADSAHVFGMTGDALFVGPIDLLRAQLRIWKEPEVYHPEAVTIVTEIFANSRTPFGAVIDDPAGLEVIQELLGIVGDEVATGDGTGSASRLLWRVLSGSVSYLVASRSKSPSIGWATAFKAIRQVFELGVATVGALEAAPGMEVAKFLHILLLPALLGVAAIPSFQDVAWNDVVSLLPSLGGLASRCKGGALGDLRSAALALLAKLGHAIIGQGSLPVADDGVQEILLSPLLCIVPKSVFGSNYTGIPLGVGMVEQATGFKLRMNDEAPGEIDTLLAEVINTSSTRAETMMKSFNAAAKTNRSFFSARVQNLLFCVLIKQFNAKETLESQLEDYATGDAKPDPALLKLWQQAKKLEPWLLSVKQRLAMAGRDGKAIIEAMQQALEILILSDQEVHMDVFDDGDGLEGMWERQRPFVKGAPSSPKSAASKTPSVRWGTLSEEVDALKRLQLLLQDVPPPGANVPAQHIKSFFEAKWFTSNKPISLLLAGIESATLAVWRRAAGLTLLAWCVQECGLGAEAWVSALAVDSLAEASRKESSMPRCCAETSAVVALAAARQFSIAALSKFSKESGSASLDQDTPLQVMSIAGLSAAWRSTDQDLLLSADILTTIRPFLPWSTARSNFKGYAACLALQSLVAMPPTSEQTPLGSFSNALLIELQAAFVETVGKSSNAMHIGSMLKVFDAKSKQKKTSDLQRGPSSHEVIRDLRRRLERGEDFGGLENAKDDWELWLLGLEETWFPNGKVPRLVEEFQAQQESGEPLDHTGEVHVEFTNFDVNADGHIDAYEFLWVLMHIAMVHSECDEYKHFPRRLPGNYPRFFGDVPIVNRGEGSPFDMVPLPSSTKSPSSSLLRALDGLLRAQNSSAISTTTQFNEAILTVATDESESPATAVLALRILQALPPSQATLDAAALKLLQSLASIEGGPLWARGSVRAVISQRAEVLRTWIGASEAGSQAVSAAIAQALKSDSSPEAITAALFVIGGPPGLYLFASALSEGEGRCLVVDTEVGGVTWEFHPRTDFTGKDILQDLIAASEGVEALKQRCLDLNGMAFTTNGCIKRDLLSRDEWGEAFDEENEGLYVAYRDDDVAVLPEGASAVVDVETTSLQMLPKRCEASKLSKDMRCQVVDLALKQKSQEAWALSTVLSEPDAVSHFLAQRGFQEWLPLALDTKLEILARFSPAERSSISAAVRLEFPGAYKEWLQRGGDNSASVDCQEASIAEVEEAFASDEKDSEEALFARTRAGVAAVIRASRGLGDDSTLTKRDESLADSLPDLAEMLTCSRSLLSRPSPRRVARLHGITADVSDTPIEKKSLCGLVDSTSAKGSSSKPSLKSLFWKARSNTKDLNELVSEAAQWDQQVLAVDICLAVVMHLASLESPFPDESVLPPADQLAELLLVFEKTLDSASARAKARNALISLVGKTAPLRQAVQELTVAHLLGSLGYPSGANDEQLLDFESPHLYENGADTTETVKVPGATSYRITFDSQCCSESGCDYLEFFEDSSCENSITRLSGKPPWEDFVIESPQFTFKWHTDSSCVDWGYKFSVTPEGLPKKNKDKKTPKQDSGLWLLEFLMDMVSLCDDGSAAIAQPTLRSEFAALLLAHLARQSHERLINQLLRFIEATKKYNLSFDWICARDALESMTAAAQENGQQSALQRCVALRLALPEVKVSSDSPRFCAPAAGVLLLDEEHVCTQRTKGETFCFIKKAGPMKVVKVARLTQKEVWIGVVHAVGDTPNPEVLCMARIKEDISFTTSDDTYDIVDNQVPEIKVHFDVGSAKVTFEGPNFSHVSTLPTAPEGGGKWRFAVKLCEFGSSTRVSPPGGVSDSNIQQIRESMEAIQAICDGGDLPDSFMAAAFGDWWANHYLVQLNKVPSEELAKLGEIEGHKDLIVMGAGIPKYNGIYKALPSDDGGEHSLRNGFPIYTNEAGCQFCFEASEACAASWCLEEHDECPVYACVWFNESSSDGADAEVDAGYEFGPMLSVVDNAGPAPTICTKKGLPTCKVLLECAPPKISTWTPPEEMPDDVCATQVLEFHPSTSTGSDSELTLIYLDIPNGRAQSVPPPIPMYADTASSTPKQIPGWSAKVWGKKACIIASKSEWTQCEDPTLFFKGGENHSLVRLLNLQKLKAGGPYAKLFPHLATRYDSVHPLPCALKNSTLKVSLAETSGMSLSFGLKCQLPAETVILVTLDEAGNRPAALERTGALAGGLVQKGGAVTNNPQRAAMDAARGVLSHVKGANYTLEASECFLHFPALRPVQWEPLKLPVPVVQESEHPYKAGTNISSFVTVPGAEGLHVEFHTSCCTETNYDMLKFFRNCGGDEDTLVASYHGEGPWESFDMSGDTVWYSFSCDEGNEYWGYGFTVTARGPGTSGIQPGVMKGIPKLFADSIQFGGDGTLLFVGNTTESVEEMSPEVAAECEFTGYVMRYSNVAMNWLRPGVLAGEVSIDFTGAPIVNGDLAVGVALLPSAGLMWPAPALAKKEVQSQATEKADTGKAAEITEGTGGGGSDCGDRAGPTEAEAQEVVLCEDVVEEAVLEDWVKQAWLWRCDGASLLQGKSGEVDKSRNFGAGDVVGVVATVDGKCLKTVEFLRNGVSICSAEVDLSLTDNDSSPHFCEISDGCALSLCLAMRCSSVCASLLPVPQLLEQLPAESMQEGNLLPSEAARASAIFKGLDTSGDGALQREEITTALGDTRSELFQALDVSRDGKVSMEEWLQYCRRVSGAKGTNGLGLFLEAFRKKLLHKGKAVEFPQSDPLKETWGVQVTAMPRNLTVKGCLDAAKLHAQDAYGKFNECALSGWTREADAKAVALFEWLCRSAEDSEEKKSPESLELFEIQSRCEEGRKVFPELTESSDRLVARFIIFKQLHKLIQDRILPFCDLGDLRACSFGRCVSDARLILFGNLGTERFDQIIEETFTNSVSPMKLDRQLATDCKMSNSCDYAGERMLFAQASKLAEKISDNAFRSRGKPLEIKYANEDGVDAGGLYRDFLDACATELMSPQLPLLIPTPNAQNNAGECREAWTLAPIPMTKAIKRMLHCLGRLMGICVRRGDVLPLSLSQVVWKLLVDDEPTLDDLACVDIAAAESVKSLMHIEALQIAPEDFETYFGEMYFVYHNSAKIEVPLLEGGAQTRVTYETAKKFASLVQKMRLHEAQESIDCIKAGMATVVPVGCFAMWSWRDLEMKVCGDPNIDTKVLRNHVTYESASESDAHVKFLWQALDSFSQQDLQRFLRFVWGRSRLPPEGSPLWDHGFKICGADDLPSNGLPLAHTCFFQIDLPKYETRQMCEEKVLFAIRNCLSLAIA